MGAAKMYRQIIIIITTIIIIIIIQEIYNVPTLWLKALKNTN